jgi:hypothetical protein
LEESDDTDTQATGEHRRLRPFRLRAVADRIGGQRTAGGMGGDAVLTGQDCMDASALSSDAMICGKNRPGVVLMRPIFVPMTAGPNCLGAPTREDAAACNAGLFISLDTAESGPVTRDERAVRTRTTRSMEEALSEDFADADTDRAGDLTEDAFPGANQTIPENARNAAKDATRMHEEDVSTDDMSSTDGRMEVPHRSGRHVLRNR